MGDLCLHVFYPYVQRERTHMYMFENCLVICVGIVFHYISLFGLYTAELGLIEGQLKKQKERETERLFERLA